MDIFHVFQMVGATHGTPEGFRPDQASDSQQPPPPPPPQISPRLWLGRQSFLIS
jgi:hypothetical protein